MARALLAMSYELDVSDLLAQVRAPTLVVHRAHDRAAPVEQAAALAGGIAGAQLTVLPGRSHLPYAGDADALVATVRRFLGLRVSRRGARTLTARQGEVAALISEGCTNRELAGWASMNGPPSSSKFPRTRTLFVGECSIDEYGSKKRKEQLRVAISGAAVNLANEEDFRAWRDKVLDLTYRQAERPI
ncbi:hypothetical protein [Rhodococcus sp. ARC_M6]|uniref:hypothetical protein n=1 Tax=Rhodococcus sp. ARC_M6 TaxID=2928852 RepID=UPI001FB2F64B|nr:hypothetical protein [Rhodococcus sp. ARC_M6]MCJ0907470.1 hypothetical protein [Rhodococcus sp. ARC_M6]